MLFYFYKEFIINPICIFEDTPIGKKNKEKNLIAADI